jgi:hypothetical protein
MSLFKGERLVDSIVEGNTTFAGHATGDVLDFSAITRESGKKFIRIGTYGSPVAYNGTGVFQAYSVDTGNASVGYLFFHLMRGTGTDALIGEQMLLESETTVTGPASLAGHDVLVGLTSVSSRLATAADHTSGMFGGHFKIYSVDGATVASGARAACLWLDGQMNGANASPVAGNYYNIYNTSGGNKYEAFAKLHLIAGEGAGWNNLFETNFSSGTDPIVTAGTAKDVKDNQQALNIKVDINGTTYYIPLMAVA